MNGYSRLGYQSLRGWWLRSGVEGRRGKMDVRATVRPLYMRRALRRDHLAGRSPSDVMLATAKSCAGGDMN